MMLWGQNARGEQPFSLCSRATVLGLPRSPAGYRNIVSALHHGASPHGRFRGASPLGARLYRSASAPSLLRRRLAPGSIARRPRPVFYGAASALASPASAGAEASGMPSPPLPACMGAPAIPARPPAPAGPLPAKPPLPPGLLPPPPPAPPPPTPPSLKSRTRSVPQEETLLSSTASAQRLSQRDRRSPLTPTASTTANSEDVSKRSTL
ncbi:MAG: hypothetical protein RL685_1314 [Pseudomonadota bacterium]